MNKIVSAIIMVAFSSTLLEAFAETGVWTNIATQTSLTQSSYWTTSSNWEGGYVPGGAGKEADTADLSIIYANPDNANFFHTITLPVGNAAVNFTNATIIGSNRRRLRSLIDGSNAGAKSYAFTDLSGFAGYLSPLYPVTLKFLGSTTVSNLCVQGQPIVNVEKATDTLTIDRAYDWGKMRKTGPGTLSLSKFAGEEVRLQVHEGKIELHGGDAAASQTAPGGTPLIWLDATVTNRMTLVDNGDGTWNVTQWSDCRSDKNYWYAQFKSGTDKNPPVLTTRTEDGSFVLDFGPLLSYGHEDSRSMRFSSDPDRSFTAVYFVFKTNGSYSPPLLGDELSKDFMQDTGTAYTSGRAPYLTTADGLAATKLGDLSIDGNRIFYNSTYALSGYHVLAYIPGNGGKIRGQGLCFNRSTGWGGAQVAEVLLYNTSVTEDQHRQTIAYLKNKWLKGLSDDRVGSWDCGDVVLAANTSISVPSGRQAAVKSISAMAGESITKEGAGALDVELIANAPHGKREGNNGYNSAAPLPVFVSAGTLRLTKCLADEPDLSKADLPSGAAIHLDATDEDSFVFSSGNEISIWKDTRTDGTGCAWTGTKPTVMPKLVRGGINGRNCVDMSDSRNSEVGTWMNLDFTSQAASTAPSTSQSLNSFFVVMEQLRAGGGYGDFIPLGLSNGRPLFPISAGALSGGDFVASKPTEYRYSVPCAYYGLDGVPIYQGTYTMITNTVVFSCNLNDTININRLAADRTYWTGGFRFGEIIGYKRCLSAAEVRQVESYLLRKWKGVKHPYDRAREIGATSVAAGSTLALGPEASVKVSGDMALAAGATLSEEGVVGDAAPLEVTGALTLASGAKMKFVLPTELPKARMSYPVVKCGSLSGSLDSVVLELSQTVDPKEYKTQLVYRDGMVKLNCSPIGGLVLIFR